MERAIGEICCRLCFCSDGNFLSIFNDAPSVFDIAMLLKKYFQDEIKLSDPLPNIICGDCWHKTESFHEFHEKVLSERDMYLNSRLNGIAIESESDPILNAEVLAGQFDELDMNMCVDPITVEPIQIDSPTNVKEEHDTSASDCSLKESDNLLAIDYNGSHSDDYDCIVKEDYEYESNSWPGNDEDNDNNDSEPENSSVPTNITELSTSQIQEVVTKHFDMKCEQCETTFSGFFEAKSHYQFAHNIERGYVKCCDLKITDDRVYRGHVLWHLNPHAYDCLICGISHNSIRSYHSHKLLHKNKAMKRFICDTCGAEFAMKQNIVRHILDVHAAKKMYFCDKCGNNFRTDLQFNLHNQYVHSGIDTQLTPERIEEFICTVFDMKCEIKPCKMVFESLQDARDHYLNVHKIPNGWIKCCNSKFMSPTTINEHIAWHINPTVFQCAECGLMSKTNSSMRRHMMRHKAKRRTRQTPLEHEELLECDYCHKTFLNKSKLIEHMKFIHEPEIQKIKQANVFSRFFDMTCDKCENVFKSLDEAITHYNQMHDNQKGYIKCCNFQFNDNSLASDHLKWHLNPNIFKCDQCDEKLSTRKELQSHIRGVHSSSSFICDYCGKCCETRSRIERHMRHVHVDAKMRYRCGLCEKRFGTFREQHTHLESKHPDDLKNIVKDTKKLPLLNLNDERMKAMQEQHVDQKCDICHVKFDSFDTVKNHYLAAHKKPKGYVKCCRLKFHGKEALINHLNWHVNPNIFRCRLCLKILASRRTFKSHIKKHETMQRRRFICVKCSDIFPSSLYYRTHMKTFHNINIRKRNDGQDETKSTEREPAEEENVYLGFDMTCDMNGCSAEFTSLVNAREHYLNVHTYPNGYVKCCDMKLKTQLDVRDHIAWHKDPGIFKCKECEREFKCRLAISRHTENFHSEISSLPKCYLCKKRFEEKAKLDEHMSIYHEKQKYPCTEPNCNKGFVSRHYLNLHRERCHPTGEKIYMCEICGVKKFEHVGRLNHHLKTVHKQGPPKPKKTYQCDICLKFYASQGSLFTHKLTHSTEIFKCTLCDKISPTASALTGHMHTVHVEKELNCTICDKKFKLASSLKDHVATHLNNKQWKCEYCDLEFFCRPNMYKHRKQIHRIEWEADKAKKEADKIMLLK